MNRRRLFALIGGAVIRSPFGMAAQASNGLQQVGVVLEGGPYYAGLDGLREGLKAAGLEEGPQLAFVVRDTRGDLKEVERVASALERDDRVDLIVTFAASVTLAVRRSTAKVPIVFISGTDPVALGLIDSVARPGGRLTGIHNINTDLIPKRLELLRDVMPRLRRAVTFYDPDNRSALASLTVARSAAHRLGIDLVDQPVRSPEEIRERLRALRPGDAEAYVFTADAMVLSQSELILERSRELRMATVGWADLVRRGALLGYGFNYRDLGRRVAEYVSRILSGSRPSDLPVEAISVPELVINLKTAKALGLTVPQTILARADEVIE